MTDAAHPAPADPAAPLQIVLDTDVGDDIDDALALALILASPELELLGVSTVFGNVAARSRQARTILHLAGDPARSVPVAAGCAAVMSTRTYPPECYWYDEQSDPDHVPNQDACGSPEAELPPADPRHGVDLLIDLVLAGDGTVVPVGIGPLTNLAMALVKSPEFRRKVPRLVVMAGELSRPSAEYNVRCDPESAAVVFASGLPVDVVPAHVGHTLVKFRPEHVERLRASTRPVGQYLWRAVDLWQRSHAARRGTKAHKWMPFLYDPMAVAALTRPDLMTWRRGRLTVELAGANTYGQTTFAPDPAGPHLVAEDADVEASIGYFLDRVAV